MITYAELRKEVQTMNKITGCVKIERPLIINEAFPGQFNLSFTEQPMLDEYGANYLNFDHDFVFSTIPSCIRYSDLFDEKTKASNLVGNNAWKYLGVFEMADLAGMATYKGIHDIFSLQKKQAENLINLLENYGIKKEQIFPTYQPLRKLSEIPQKRKEDFPFDFIIPEDEIGKQVFLDLGIPEKNIIEDYSGATLLRLYLSKRTPNGLRKIPSPWGYRNEININLGTKQKPKLIDIGTLERMVYKPIIVKEKIIGLSEINDTVSIGALGLERICMVVNRLLKVQDIDSIKPFYQSMPKVHKPVLIGEYLRALHFICTDLPTAKEKYNFTFDKHKKTRRRFNKIRGTILNSDLTIRQIKNLLIINSENQPWHPELKEGIELTVGSLEKYKSILNYNKN